MLEGLIIFIIDIFVIIIDIFVIIMYAIVGLIIFMIVQLISYRVFHFNLYKWIYNKLVEEVK